MEKELRPKLHFTPPAGWMNDPNGAIYYAGKYHLFYQHNPYSMVWDHMHWGHAVSEDLVHWEHMPIALFPDGEGDIFSGSCVYDSENRSGLGTGENPPLLAFYTSHHPETKREMQCVAVSTDGVHFEKYENNPIIPAIEKTVPDNEASETSSAGIGSSKSYLPARDPQVFYNTVLGGFSLCLTTEKEILFYHSEDLLSWEKTGVFRLPEYAFRGMIECPCLFFAEADGTKKAVLMMSMDVPEKEFAKFPEGAIAHSRLMQYFVGDFDGKTFVSDARQKSAFLVDYGRDFYAGCVFAGCSEPILIAWLGNSPESMEVPTEKEGFRGIMSYPRKLSLCDTPDGYRLKHEFYPASEDMSKQESDLFCEKIILVDGCVREEISEDGLVAKTCCVLP